MSYRDDPGPSRLDRISDRLMVAAPHGKIPPRMQVAFAVLLGLLACVVMGAVVMGAADGGRLMLPVIWAGVILNLVSELRKPSGSTWDEREQLLRMKALLWAATIPLSLVVLWAFILGVSADEGLWHPRQGEDWEAVALFLVSLWSSTATFVAAWNTPAYAATLDDDED